MKKYAIVGNPISHSQSPFIHQQFARQTHIDLSYEALKLDCATKTDFKQALQTLFTQGYLGLNITLPYKIWAFEISQEKNGLSTRAEESGAVNTLTFTNQDTWSGDNTDGVGLVSDLKNNLDWPIKAMNILILGAGGAARGTIAALLHAEPDCIHILNRDPSKAENLAKIFSNVHCEIKNINSRSTRTYQLIINATSSSLWQQLPSTIQQVDAKNACCYDMVYAPLPTVFLDWAIANQANATSDGLGMLVEQAAHSFYQWHQRMPETHPVIQQLRQNL
jgi:shikimate dehydrogenase